MRKPETESEPERQAMIKRLVIDGWWVWFESQYTVVEFDMWNQVCIITGFFCAHLTWPAPKMSKNNNKKDGEKKKKKKVQKLQFNTDESSDF